MPGKIRYAVLGVGGAMSTCCLHGWGGGGATAPHAVYMLLGGGGAGLGRGHFLAREARRNFLDGKLVGSLLTWV